MTAWRVTTPFRRPVSLQCKQSNYFTLFIILKSYRTLRDGKKFLKHHFFFQYSVSRIQTSFGTQIFTESTVLEIINFKNLNQHTFLKFLFSFQNTLTVKLSLLSFQLSTNLFVHYFQPQDYCLYLKGSEQDLTQNINGWESILSDTRKLGKISLLLFGGMKEERRYPSKFLLHFLHQPSLFKSINNRPKSQGNYVPT